MSDAVPENSPTPRRRDWVHGRFRTFVRASIDDVWALVSDPSRWDEWDPTIGDIAAETPEAEAWIAVSPTHRGDGEPLKIEPELRRRRITQIETDAPSRVVWWTEFPDAADAAPRMLAVELEPTDDGTFVMLTSTWRRGEGWRRRVGWVLRPLQNRLVGRDLSRLGGAISRALA